MNRPTSIQKNPIAQLGLTSYQMSTSINLAQRAFRTLLKTCLSHHGLTIPQWTLLGELYSSGTVRPIQASRLLGITPPYIAKLVSELETKGIITTSCYADDGRGKAIALSQSGKELVESVEGQLSICLNEQLGSLELDDLATYFGLTKYIAVNVKHLG